MSIQSLRTVYGPPTVAPRPPNHEAEENSAARRSQETLDPGGPPRALPVSIEAASAENLSAAPPEGTDPDLWSVLTAEERHFFARAKALGPITYSPANFGIAEFGLQRGARIDVKV